MRENNGGDSEGVDRQRILNFSPMNGIPDSQCGVLRLRCFTARHYELAIVARTDSNDLVAVTISVREREALMST